MGEAWCDQAIELYSPIKNVDLKTYPDLNKNFLFFINLKVFMADFHRTQESYVLFGRK